MPIVVSPTPIQEIPPSVYRICGVSMHNVAEPTRQEVRLENDQDGNPVEVPVVIANGYMVIEWEAGDLNDAGAFVRRHGGQQIIAGDAFLSYLNDMVGAAVAALLKLYRHQAMVEAGVFPVGQNAMMPEELQAISTFCGTWLGGP